MNAAADWSCRSDSPAATARLGHALGRALVPGDFVALHGDLGTGKTVLVRGMARGLRVSARVPVRSPSFTLVNLYPGRLMLHHCDFYRLADAEELEALGFRDVMDGEGAVVAEWAERGGAYVPADHLAVRLVDAGPRERLLSFHAGGARAARLLAAFREQLAHDAVGRAGQK